MADNVAITAGSGTSIATDDVGGVHYQRVKIGVGADGAATDVSSSTPLPVNLPISMLDSFGKVQAVNCINDIDVQFFRDVPANLVTVTTANGGSATQTTGLVQFATSTATNGSAKGVSLDTVMYRSGGEIYALMTAAWIDGGAATSYQRIGLYDTNNGVYIGYENTTFGIVVRQGGVDGTQTAKTSFNIDTLVGAAGSKFTRAGTPEAIDLAKLNVFRIRFGWLGAAPIKFEVLSPDGEWVLFHVIRQPNNATTPHIYSTDLPITCDLAKTAGAGNLRLNTACWGAGVTYDKTDIVGSGTLGTAANSAVNYQTQGVAALQVRCGTSTTGTMIFEGTVDGTNWVTMPNVWLVGAAGAPDTPVSAAVTPTSANIYRVPVANFRGVRVRTATTLGATVILHVQGEERVSLVGFSGGGIGKVEGGVAHDSVDAGPPLKVGAKAIAHGANPTAVAAADRTDVYANRAGVLFTIGGHPNVVTLKHTTITTAVTDAAIVTVSAGTKIVVTRITATLDSASTVFPTLLIGFGTANTPTTTGVLVSHGGVPAGGGVNVGDGSGILGIGADNEDLRVTTTGNATGNGLQICVSYYTIES